MVSQFFSIILTNNKKNKKTPVKYIYVSFAGIEFCLVCITSTQNFTRYIRERECIRRIPSEL